MTVRALRWWLLAQEIAAGLTFPRTDIAASDLAFERMLRQSALFGVAHAAGEALGRAWRHSRLRSIVTSTGVGSPRSDRRRGVVLVALMIVIACLTAVMLHTFRSLLP